MTDYIRREESSGPVPDLINYYYHIQKEQERSVGKLMLTSMDNAQEHYAKLVASATNRVHALEQDYRNLLRNTEAKCAQIPFKILVSRAKLPTTASPIKRNGSPELCFPSNIMNFQYKLFAGSTRT